MFRGRACRRTSERAALGVVERKSVREQVYGRSVRGPPELALEHADARRAHACSPGKLLPREACP
jgi:hypothetical protein